VGVLSCPDVGAVMRAVKAGVDEVVSIEEHQLKIAEIVVTGIANPRRPTRAFESRPFVNSNASHLRIRRFEEPEADIFRFALKQTGGCVSQAAGALGVGRATMYRKIRDYQIEIPPVGQRTGVRMKRGQILESLS